MTRHGLRGARSPSPSPEVVYDLHDRAPDESEDGVAPDAENLPEASIDTMDHVGLVANWSLYDAAEQIHRFDSLAHRADTLSMMYGLMPASAAGALFDRRAVEQAKDSTLTLDDLNPRDLPTGRIIVGVDPATASGPRASWFVAAVCLFVPATKTDPELRIVLDIVRERGIGSVEVQGNILQELADAWRPSWFAIEAVGAFSYLATYAEHSLSLAVKPVITGEQQRNEIPALADEVRRGRWVIPWGDSATQRRMAPLVTEMIDFPEGTKDILMALTFCRRTNYEAPAKRKATVRLGIFDIGTHRWA
jgi:hypothetical protein